MLSIRVIIRDPKILARISPHHLARYLRSRGWHEEELIPGRSSTWTLEDGEDTFEILLPLDETFRDYAYRISDTLQTLEKVESRTQLALVADMAPAVAAGLRVDGAST